MQKDTWEDLEYKVQIQRGYAIIMTTDRFVADEYPLSTQNKEYLKSNIEKLLDMRIFNEHAEYRVFRGDIGRSFMMRFKQDTEGEDYYDDEQYLDIDESRSAPGFQKGKQVRATGGGYYALPLDSCKGIKLIIRNYLGYRDGSGQAYIKDWRLLGFYQENKGGKV